jgi:hypothetical protein
MSEDAGDEFSKTVKSIGNDLWALFKTIVEERRRREREARAQEAAEAKEKTGLERDEKIRKEEREFMKAENEKTRAEMRDVLKANGMEVSDKNMTLAQDSLDKMEKNGDSIDTNDKRIDDIDKRLGEIDNERQEALKSKVGEDGSLKSPDHEKAKALDDEATKLKNERAGLNEANSKLEAENVMLKNGRGLDQLKQDETVKNNLAKQMDQLNAGISRQKSHLDRCNGALANIEKEQGKILDSPKPDMDKWEKLQKNKETWQKEKAVAEQGLAKKEGQLNDLKQGKSLEQLEKAAKIEGNIAQVKQEIGGQDKVINAYKTNQKDLAEQQKQLAAKREELLKNGKLPEGPEVQGIQKEMRDLEQREKAVQEKLKPLEQQKKELEGNVAKLEKELDGVNNPQKGPEKSLGNKGPEQSLGEKGPSPKVGGEKSWRPGSVGDTLNKEGYKIGGGPKHGRSMSVGGVK